MAAGTPNMHCNVTHLTEVIKRTATNIFQVEMAATTHDLHFLPFLTLIGGVYSVSVMHTSVCYYLVDAFLVVTAHIASRNQIVQLLR